MLRNLLVLNLVLREIFRVNRLESPFSLVLIRLDGIFDYCDFSKSGFKFLTDGVEFICEPYSGVKKLYECGKQYVFLNEKKDCFFVCLVDVNNVLITKISDSVEVLFKDESLVSNKQRSGGQSAKRFNENREIMIDHWFKDIAVKLQEFNPEKWILGINQCYEKRFRSKLSTNLLNSLCAINTTSYVNENGVIELLNKCEKQIEQYEWFKNKVLVEKFERLLFSESSSIKYGIKYEIKGDEYCVLYSNLLSDDTKKHISSFNNTKEVKGFPIVDSLKICVIDKN